MTFKYDITAADVALAQSLAAKMCRNEVQKAMPLRILRATLIIVGALVFSEAFSLAEKYRNTEIASNLSWVLWPALAFITIFFAYVREYQKRFAAWRDSELAPFPIQQQLSVTPDGLLVESRFGQAQYPWSTIRTLSTLEEHFSFTTAAASVVIVPFRAFSSLEERNKFEAELRTHVGHI